MAVVVPVTEEEEETEVMMAELEAGSGSGAAVVGVTARAVTAFGHGVVAAGGSVEGAVVLVVAPYIGIAVDATMGAIVGEEDMLTNQLTMM